MGKTRTAVVSGEPKPAKKELKKKQRKKHKRSLREEKGVRIPGLKGGERIVAVDAQPLPEPKEEKEKKVEKSARPPKTRGKKYKATSAKVDKTKFYPLVAAVKLVKETSYSRFDGTVELHLVIKKEGMSASVKLPHSTGKQKRIEIANTETLKKLKEGKIDFDVLLATPEMMPKLVPYAKILGPRGLMPNPKEGTIIKDKSQAKKFSANTVNLKTERKTPLVHTTIGKVSQKEKELVENATAIITALGKRQVQRAYLTSTMGPSVKIDLT